MGARASRVHRAGRALPLPLLPHADRWVCGSVHGAVSWELARVIKAGACIEASFKRGKGEVGMDEYQVRTWEGWPSPHSLIPAGGVVLDRETHRGQRLTPALTLPQVRYGLSCSCGKGFTRPVWTLSAVSPAAI